MPYQYQGHPLYEQFKTITAGQLNRGGLFVDGKKRGGILSWDKTEVTIVADLRNPDDLFISFIYGSFTDTVSIVRFDTWLKNRTGYIYEFICPVTAKRARKLYCFNGRFMHREAAANCYYSIQQRSKLDLLAFRYCQSEELRKKQYERYYHPLHMGKPTRAAKKIQKGLEWESQVWAPAVLGFLGRNF